MVKSILTIIRSDALFGGMTKFLSLGGAIGLACLCGAAPAFARGSTGSDGTSGYAAHRFGAPMTKVLVTARIVRASASIGRGYGPPAPRMKPRHTQVTAADGQSVAALVYDFE